MRSEWTDRRRQLLQALQNVGGAGRAEIEPQDRIGRGYYPVTEHLRLLDPEVVLVVGPRGSGKTEITRVLVDDGLREAVARHAPKVRLPSAASRWIQAYPLDAAGFEHIGLQAFVKGGATADALRNLWFAYLVRTVKEQLSREDRTGLAKLLKPPGADIKAVLGAFDSLGSKPVEALDRLDGRLARDDEHLFVAYDELDTLGGGNWSLVEAGVRGLVAFWASYTRRWKRIRAKLFLRTDLYERHAKSGGADLAKLAAGRVDLAWSDRDLYGVLLKRLRNVDSDLGAYVSRVKGIDWKEDGTLGVIPKLRSWQDARPVVERMVGTYMGANRKKGFVYRWLLDHVRDGLGRSFPRPLVRLMEEGARQELEQFGNLREPRLLEPASLRRALDRVSSDHVAQSRDEWPWLDAVMKKLAKGRLVPWEREQDVANLLEGFPKRDDSPPFEGRELLEYMLEVGILRRRSDGRVDAPDLFLSGLGLRRKGGVKKRV